MSKVVQIIRKNPFEEIIDELSEIRELCSVLKSPVLPPDPEIINTDELCRRLALSEPTVIQMMKRRQIPYFKAGTAVRYNWPSVVAALENIKPKEQIKESFCKREIRLTEFEPFPKRNYQPVTSGKEKYIYIMRNKHNWLYKIGISADPKFREKTLMSSEPSIELLYKWEGSEKEERLIHQKFETYRIRGEWFTLNELQLKQIILYFEN